MSTIETGGPAFPAGSVRKSRPAHDPGGNWVETDRVQPLHQGLTMRDYFATHCGVLDSDVSEEHAAALAATQGVAKPADSKDLVGLHRFWCAVIAAHRYMMADAMLEARKEKS